MWKGGHDNANVPLVVLLVFDGSRGSSLGYHRGSTTVVLQVRVCACTYYNL